MKAWIAATAVLALAGCATQEKFRAIMDTYIGASEQSLVSGLGIPSGSYAFNEHSKVLTFERSGQMVLPGVQTTQAVSSTTTGYVNSRPFTAQTTTYVPQQGAPMLIQMNCTIRFSLWDGVVRSYTWEGNNCKAR